MSAVRAGWDIIEVLSVVIATLLLSFDIDIFTIYIPAQTGHCPPWTQSDENILFISKPTNVSLYMKIYSLFFKELNTYDRQPP